MAGTSGTPLPKRLGIKSGHFVTLLNVPVAFARSLDLQPDVRWSHQLRMAVDVVVLYADGLEEVERRIGGITGRLHPEGSVWVVWPKRRANGLDEDLIRSIALAAGMTASKVCALGAAWVGVRLVIRQENRDAVAYRISDRLAAPRRTKRAALAPRIPVRISSGAGSTLRRARARSTK
jgi:Protein of unknown function (DUF3052)